ncbi:hypothetical protein Ciccas_012390 [Cichlidogyrus casuarinus]|uniref:Uncharacterized protein n=1 Tax=Cichlidogyrus casuarinus TaxID=1844966 RepID=A0ABD2PNJ4_9PLAT
MVELVRNQSIDELFGITDAKGNKEQELTQPKPVVTTRYGVSSNSQKIICEVVHKQEDKRLHLSCPLRENGLYCFQNCMSACRDTSCSDEPLFNRIGCSIEVVDQNTNYYRYTYVIKHSDFEPQFGGLWTCQHAGIQQRGMKIVAPPRPPPVQPSTTTTPPPTTTRKAPPKPDGNRTDATVSDSNLLAVWKRK